LVDVNLTQIMAIAVGREIKNLLLLQHEKTDRYFAAWR
jgi:hypothetical protein